MKLGVFFIPANNVENSHDYMDIKASQKLAFQYCFYFIYISYLLLAAWGAGYGKTNIQIVPNKVIT